MELTPTCTWRDWKTPTRNSLNAIHTEVSSQRVIDCIAYLEIPQTHLHSPRKALTLLQILLGLLLFRFDLASRG